LCVKRLIDLQATEHQPIDYEDYRQNHYDLVELLKRARGCFLFGQDRIRNIAHMHELIRAALYKLPVNENHRQSRSYDDPENQGNRHNGKASGDIAYTKKRASGIVEDKFIPTSFGAIRPWSSADAAAMVKYANNRRIWLNLRDAFPHPYSEDNARAFLEIVEHQNPTTFFAIATDEEAIGGIGIVIKQDVHRLTAELGYWLAEPYWGKGLMTEAVFRFTEYAFERFDLRRIYAEPYAGNAASSRVLEKAGFTLEGRLRCSVIKDDRIMDQFLYARIRSEESAKEL
jgi:ribosomal-protein-alanine N-acetyltransferase